MKSKLVLVLFLVMFVGCSSLNTKVDLTFDTFIKTDQGDVACQAKFKYDSEGKQIDTSAHCSFKIMVGDKRFDCKEISLDYMGKDAEKTLSVETQCNLET